MADGRISIKIEVDGKEVNVASKELDKLESSGSNAGKGVKQTEQGLKGVGDESRKASSNVKKFATALGLIAVGVAAFNALRKSMDAAISRFDTLNNFPKVLQALGVSAEDSERAINRLSDGIDGLPTTLDDIAASAQRFYTSFNDMEKATDTALALNNALLGSGSSAEDAQRGTEQYLQALQRGKFEMEEWKTLQETMDVGLIKIAESFGFTGKTAKTDLYDALSEGIITMDQFNDKLIEVGTGTGIMAQLAKENTQGIATSLSNLRNAAARGIANIIDSFDKLSREVTGKSLAENIDGLKEVITAAFKVIGNAIEASAPIVKGFVSVLSTTIDIAKTLSPVLIGLATAYVGLMIINKVSSAIKASNALLNIATASTQGLTLATKGQMTAQVANTAVKKADIVATAAQNGLVKTSTLLTGVLTGKTKLSTAAMVAKTAAAKAMGTAMRFLSGPVGWVTAGIGAVATAAVAVVKWFKRTSKEAERLNKETEKLGESTDELNDALKDTAKSYKESQNEIDKTSKANEELAKKVEELAEKEKKSAADKALLNSYIEELNSNVEGLNLAYDEEADKLNISSQQMMARIELMKEQEKAQEAQSRLTEILKEQQDVEAQLAETNALRDEWNQKLEEGSVKSKEHKKAIEELDEQEKTLQQTLADLSEQQALTEEQITTSTENITAAIESGNLRQITSYEDLSESQKETFDNMKEQYDSLRDHATNAFEKISTESEISLGEMIENLEHNQQVVQEWGENQAKLMEWAAEQGHTNFMNWISQLGPDHAGELALLVENLESSSEDQRKELEKLAEIYESGGDTATEALKNSLGGGFDEAVDVMINFVDDGSKALRDQIISSGFDEIGNMATDGFSKGVEEGTPKVEQVFENMAKKTEERVKKTLGIQSPSKVFKEIGTDAVEGMTLGVSEGTTRVVDAMKNLAKSSVGAFRNIRSDFNTIGRDAMAGLNAGLNAGRAQVMATARNIANSVKSTIQSALAIHSPSRVMRDEIGKMIPAGIALGIKDNAKTVYKELENLSNKMIISTPEQALKTSRMARMSTNSNVTNITKHDVNNSKVINVNTQADSDNKIANQVEKTVRRIMFQMG